MAISIILIAFLLTFCSTLVLLGHRLNFKEILLNSALFFSLILVFITEIASLFNQLNDSVILICWVVFSALNFWYLYLKRAKLHYFKALLLNKIKEKYKALNTFEKVLFVIVSFILVLIFAQGLIYPPNNWDSMTYHLSRIPNWISHQSVNHYPTHILRQLYQPPFAEFVILHFNILSHSDYFSNSVQFIYLCFSIVAIGLIIEQFGLLYQNQLIIIVLIITIPEVILQASSTQNDIVVSFFLLSAVNFSIKAIKETVFLNYFFLGIAIGLGILTKGTAYLYFFPIIIIGAIALVRTIYQTKNYLSIKYAMFAILLGLAINSTHFYRNYKLTNNVLGVDRTESKMYANQNMSPSILLSNIIKNASLHTGSYPINQLSDKVIRKLHSVLAVNIDDASFNFNNINYSSPPGVPNQEDTAPNLIHFLLLGISIILVIKNSIKTRVLSQVNVIYLVMLILQIILFCIYLKWQPWHTRLHTPLFLLSIPLIYSAFNFNKQRASYFYFILPVMLFFTLIIVCINYSRPYFTNTLSAHISIHDERFKQYFANRLELYPEYKNVVNNIRYFKYSQIGLLLHEDDWEYPIFSTFYGDNINSIHINVTNLSKKIAINASPIDCIVSTSKNDSVINYQSNRFYNMNRTNKFIWLYQKK